MTTRVLFASAALCLLAGCARPDSVVVPTPDAPPSPERKTIELLNPENKVLVLDVEVADETAEQQQGLMQRTELPEGTGMLFIFSAEQPLSFWMKNTLIPLDIIFFDESRAFVSASTMTPCKADPCQTYPSDGDALYALEVPAGFVEEFGVGMGWKLSVH